MTSERRTLPLSRRAAVAGGFAGLALAGSRAAAQERPANFPVRPIEMIVPYPAGGGVDITARTLAQEAGRILGHEFRVQNRVGGAGLVGHTYMTKAAPADGYSIGIIANPFFALDFLTREGDFSFADVVPLCSINFAPILWVTRTASPLGGLDFDGVVEEARRRPGELKMGVTPNNAFQFAAEVVERAKGIKFTHVPFQGGRPGVTALLGGNIDVTSCFYEEVEQQVRAGELKVLGVTDDRRFEPLPDVPTMVERGVPMPGGVWGANRCAIVRNTTPEPVRRYLEAGLLRTLNDPQTKSAFDRVGIVIRPAGSAETAQVFRSTQETLTAFLTETGRPVRR